jgi:hypothetical protein
MHGPNPTEPVDSCAVSLGGKNESNLARVVDVVRQSTTHIHVFTDKEEEKQNKDGEN